MEAILKLQDLGYRVSLEGDTIEFVWSAPGKPDPSQVEPLLEEVKAHKPRALRFLKEQNREDTLTPGQCETCRVGVRWSGHSDNLFCFFHAYYSGKASPALPVTNELRENCPIRKHKEIKRIWRN